MRPASADQLPDDVRVDRGPAARDAADRLEEIVDLEDAVLEQVAEAFGTLGEQMQRTARFHDLREQQHADVGILGANVSAAWAPSSVWVGGIRTSRTATSGS